MQINETSGEPCHYFLCISVKLNKVYTLFLMVLPLNTYVALELGLHPKMLEFKRSEN